MSYGEIFLDEDARHAVDSSDSEEESDPELDINDVAPALARPPIQLEATRSLREQLDGPLLDKVTNVLQFMDAQGLNLTIFLDALSWGDPECNSEKIRYARTGLLLSEELPSILQRWWKPPRVSGSSHARFQGATAALDNFASSCFSAIADKELENLTPLFLSHTDRDVTEDELTSIKIPDAIKSIQGLAPSLWKVLYGMAVTQRQQENNTRKNPNKILFTIFSMLAYTRSSRRGRFQKFLSIYFKFRGLSAKGFDTLHGLALTMSHKWTCNAIGKMSEKAMDEVNRLKDEYPWVLSYDNINIPFHVFSQRLDNQGEFGNGTAATVYIKRDATPLPPSANRSLQETRATGIRNPLTALDIFDLTLNSSPHILSNVKYQVLQFLLKNPEFDLATYSFSKSQLLYPPNRRHALATGPEHITLQYLLGTVNIPEASYEDNSRLVIEWLRQLRVDGAEMQQKLGLEQLIAWAGDQLTIDRLRNLFKFHAEDLNSYDRLDWLVLVNGWLHIMMCFGNSMHKQYMGTSRGRGISQAIDLLNKKGLGNAQIKGPFHHDLEELLYEMAEAHMREAWLVIGKVDSLSQLHHKSPAELVELSEKIVEDYASTNSLIKMDAKPDNQKDAVLRQTIMFCQDVLYYITLDQAIRNGDVGLMEDFLPYLLYRFIGSGSSNYAIEIIEMLQAFHREWPPEVKQFVINHCWLVNHTGKPGDFLPIDKAQEHNIKDIKVTHRSEGPNVDWEYLKKLHPAIHIIRAVTSHAEKEFATLARGKRHTVPQRELDIRTLQNSYKASRIHHFVPGRRKPSDLDYTTDFFLEGAQSLHSGKFLKNWVDGRTYERAMTQEEFGDERLSDESNSTDVEMSE